MAFGALGGEESGDREVPALGTPEGCQEPAMARRRVAVPCAGACRGFLGCAGCKQGSSGQG